MSEREHCWHLDGLTSGGRGYGEVCCNCGLFRKITSAYAIPSGHGPHHPLEHSAWVYEEVSPNCP